MGRPVKCRNVCCRPAVNLFKPQCVALEELEEVELALDEFEAIRLADLEGLYHAEAALRMNISRPTFGKILALARKKVASALIGGKALRILSGRGSMQPGGVAELSQCSSADEGLW